MAASPTKLGFRFEIYILYCVILTLEMIGNLAVGGNAAISLHDGDHKSLFWYDGTMIRVCG